MPRLERRLSDWRILVDGVEVPHSGFTITCGRNLYANGQIFLEPDRVVVQNFRPNSIVQFFFRDTTENTENELDQYKLYMEVEVVGPTHNKTPQSRSMGLGFTGLFRVFARHKLFMSSVGDTFQTPLITGGYALPQMAASVGDTGDPFSVFALAGHFDYNRPTNGDKEKPFRASKDANFAERMLPFVAYLTSFNASQRMQVVRTRLLNKIAAVPDSTLGGMIPATLSNAMFQQLQGEISANESYLDLINRFCRQVFYSWYQLPAPYTPTGGGDGANKGMLIIPDAKTGAEKRVKPQPEPGGDILQMPSIKGLDLGVFNFGQEYYRNDYVFAPELFYAMPPPCNFFMPEDIDQLDYQRVFDNEPTRVILTEPYFTENRSAFFSPVTLLRSVEGADRLKISSAEFFGTNISALPNASPSGVSMSPYQAPQHTTSSPLGRINLLSVLDENEIEKGIICRRDFNPFELFTAVAKTFEEQREEDKVFAGLAGTAGSLREGKFSEYEKIMTRLADYRYQQGIAERNATISCRGLRWAVPGFSGIIFDHDASYFCFVESLTFGHDASTGNETTNLQLSKVRVIPTLSRKDAERLESRFGAQRDERAKGYEQVNAVYGQKLAQFNDAAKAFFKAIEDMIDFIVDVRSLANNKPATGRWSREQLDPFLFLLSSNLSVSAPGLIVDPLRGAANAMNAVGASIRTSLFTTSRTESAQRFANQNGVPDNGANLKKVSTRTVRVSGAATAHTFRAATGTHLEQVPFTERERHEAGDYEEYIEGYLPVFTGGELDNAVFLISHDEGITQGTWDLIGTLAAQGEILRTQIKDYLRFQMKTVSTAIENKEKAEIDTLGDFRVIDAVTVAETDEDYIRSFFSELTGFLLPPSWFNRGFLTAKSLDQIYQSLLGCQPFYGPSTEFGRGFTGVPPGGEPTSKEIYDEYINFLQILDRLFPIIKGDTGIQPNRGGQSEDNPEGTTKWDMLNNGPELSPSPGQWIEQNIQRRQGTTLRQYLEQHGLELRRETSDPPVQEEFWVFVPKNAKDENTIFDFIVDEWELVPALKASIIQSGAKAGSEAMQGILGGQDFFASITNADIANLPGDPLVQQLKQSVKKSDHPSAPFLFRKARQEIILDYSKRHFGPRAFDGR